MLRGFMLDQRPRDVYQLGSKTLVGFYGPDFFGSLLMHHVQKLLYDHRDEELDPEHLARVIANTLYQRAWPLNPIVVGMNEQGEPFICSMDGLGAQTKSDTFAVVGTANAEVLTLCEMLYRPNLNAEELTELGTKCLRLAFQRNILSGGNVNVVVLKKGSSIVTTEIELQDG
jgi:20S proteasome subunit beta 3